MFRGVLQLVTPPEQITSPAEKKAYHSDMQKQTAFQGKKVKSLDAEDLALQVFSAHTQDELHEIKSLCSSLSDPSAAPKVVNLYETLNNLHNLMKDFVI